MILSEAFLKDLKTTIEQIKVAHQKSNPKLCALLDALYLFGDKYGKKDLSFFTAIFLQTKLDPLNLFANNKKMLMSDVSTLLVAAYGAILELQGLPENPGLHAKIQELALDIVNKGPEMFNKFEKYSKAQKEAAGGGDKPKRLLSKFALGGLSKQKKEKNKLFTAIVDVLTQDRLVDPMIDFDKEAPALLNLLFGMLYSVILTLNLKERFNPIIEKGQKDPDYFGMKSSAVLGIKIPGVTEIVTELYNSVFGIGAAYLSGKKASFLDFTKASLNAYVVYSLEVLIDTGNVMPLERLYKGFIAATFRAPNIERETKVEIEHVMGAILEKDIYAMDLGKDQESPKQGIALCNSVAGVANKDIKRLLSEALQNQIASTIVSNFTAGMNVSGYITKLCAGINDREMAKQIKYNAINFIFQEAIFGNSLSVSGAAMESLESLLHDHNDYILEIAEGKDSTGINFKAFVKILEINKEKSKKYLSLYNILTSSRRSSSLSSDGNQSLASSSGSESLSRSDSPVIETPLPKTFKS